MAKRKYTMSEAARAARVRNSERRKGKGRDWTTCKVARENLIWARHTHGSVNAALDNEKQKQKGGK